VLSPEELIPVALWQGILEKALEKDTGFSSSPKKQI
jgi:hypothetical protein